MLLALVNARADPFLLLLVQVGLILGASRIVGLIFARLHQPQVMGEMIAGLLLGPSLLGWAWPWAYGSIFPAVTHQNLENISQIGVVFFLFLIGLELDLRMMRNRGRSATAIALTSIVAPFILGVGLTWYLYYHAGHRLFDIEKIPFRAAALFMGAAMSITAFPVLARILTERNLHRTHVGVIAIASAAVNDAAAWCILAVVVAVAKVQSPAHALRTAALASGYVAAMLWLVRPLLRRLETIYQRQGRLSHNVVAVIFLLVLASAGTTAAIGIHALFGAFLMGCIMPKESQFVRHLSEKLEDYTVVFLLPIFFAYTGIKSNIGLLAADGRLWLLTALIIFIACLGKIGGSTIAARLSRFSWRESGALGILMNTRGLMELVILNIGLSLGMIDQTLFVMMVLMAITTTALTTPLLHWVYPAQLLTPAKPREPAEKYAILLPIALPKTGGPLVQLADMLIGPDREGMRLYALHLRPPVDREAYRSGLDDVESPGQEPLAPLLAQARARGIAVEPLAFVTRDVSGDICSVAAGRQVNLVMMGFHNPVIGRTMLGGVVHKVLAHCQSHVAVFVDRGFRNARRILVPYLGSQHDRLALELASRMARHAEAHVTVLHVVPPMRSDPANALNARGAVERVFKDPTSPTPVTFRVVEDASPVGVVLHQAQQFDLVIIGVAEEWGLESHLFGWRPERIARDCPCSLLIVRKSGALPITMPAGAVPARSEAATSG